MEFHLKAGDFLCRNQECIEKKAHLQCTMEYLNKKVEELQQKVDETGVNNIRLELELMSEKMEHDKLKNSLHNMPRDPADVSMMGHSDKLDKVIQEVDQLKQHYEIELEKVQSQVDKHGELIQTREEFINECRQFQEQVGTKHNELIKAREGLSNEFHQFQQQTQTKLDEIMNQIIQITSRLDGSLDAYEALKNVTLSEMSRRIKEVEQLNKKVDVWELQKDETNEAIQDLAGDLKNIREHFSSLPKTSNVTTTATNSKRAVRKKGGLQDDSVNSNDVTEGSDSELAPLRKKRRSTRPRIRTNRYSFLKKVEHGYSLRRSSVQCLN